MVKIAIDAGHGSQTAGKRTPDGYREHRINVKAAYYCEQYLSAHGFGTLKTGWNDINALDDVDTPLTIRQRTIKNASVTIQFLFMLLRPVMEQIIIMVQELKHIIIVTKTDVEIL